MQTQTIRERLGKELLFFDGAMGTMLQQAGLPQGDAAGGMESRQAGGYPGHPPAVCCRRAADILKTNTFGANRLKFGERHRDGDWPPLCGLAKEAAGQSGRDDVWVAMDIGPTGKLLQPLGDLSFEAGLSTCSPKWRRPGSGRGPTCLLIETMSDTYELKAAVLAAKEITTSCRSSPTMIFDDKGKLLTGGDIPAAVALLEGLGVDALGFNCGLGPEQMKGAAALS